MKKECPSCAMMIHQKAKTCPVCQYEFPQTSRWVQVVAILLIILMLIFYII